MPVGQQSDGIWMETDCRTEVCGIGWKSRNSLLNVVLDAAGTYVLGITSCFWSHSAIELFSRRDNLTAGSVGTVR